MSRSKTIKHQRFMELEGVRGVAALLVVVSHFALAFYPAVVWGGLTATHTQFESAIHGTPLALLYAGTFAVAIFFVLSGFVLSIGFFQTKDTKIVKKLALSRYLRLMIPALASVILAFILMSIGFSRIPEAAGMVTGSASWLDSWSFDTSFLAAIKNGTIDIFVQTGSAFNNVLWTMFTEFLGSFMVFAFLLLFAASKYRWAAYALLIVLTFNTWFMPFVFGMLMADAHAHGWLKRLQKIWVVAPLIIVGLLLGALPHRRGIDETMYAFLMKLDLASITGVSSINYQMFYLTLGAVMIILAVLLSPRLARMLSRPKVAMLGKYTFSLYLTHLLVLYVVACSLFLALYETTGYNKAVLIAGATSLPVMWIASWLFERYVDAPSVRFAKYVGAVYAGDKTIDWAKQRRAMKRKLQRIRRRFVRSSSAPELDGEAE